MTYALTPFVQTLRLLLPVLVPCMKYGCAVACLKMSWQRSGELWLAATRLSRVFRVHNLQQVSAQLILIYVAITF